MRQISAMDQTVKESSEKIGWACICPRHTPQGTENCIFVISLGLRKRERNDEEAISGGVPIRPTGNMRAQQSLKQAVVAPGQPQQSCSSNYKAGVKGRAEVMDKGSQAPAVHPLMDQLESHPLSVRPQLFEPEASFAASLLRKP